jgi:monofunctional biosynthetic peptidoglycan transglycosylase
MTPRRGERTLLGRCAGALLAAIAALLLATVASVALYGFLPPPATPLMLMRGLEERAWPEARRWVPLARISRHLQRAVIASEDQRFCSHGGFDWVELRRAWRDWRRGHEGRGASTITNQVAKNLFLWPGRSVVRKGIEAGLSVLIEAMWPKERILEIYLNIAEMGDRIYGAETAARLHFDRSAADLTLQQAALLAAALPNPRVRGDALTAPYMRQRADLVIKRMGDTRLPARGVCTQPAGKNGL